MAALATTGRDKKLCLGDGEPCAHQATTSNPVRSDREDQRLDRQKVVQFLREAENNRRQIEKLEKEQTLIALCKKHGWSDVYDELEGCEKVLEKERRAHQIHLQKQLIKIKNGVRTFQGHLIDVKPTPELIEKLKEIMSEVEISIKTLKEEQRWCFEEYLKEERTCRQEINAYDKKIENWNLSVKSSFKLTTPSTVKSKLQDRDLPAEVRALDDFLQRTGGQYGGWDQFDHQTFLKVWTKHSGQPSYRKEARMCLPGITLEDVEQHEKWHQELLSLKNKRRGAIQRWKASKQRERQTRIQTQEETEETWNRERKAKSLAEQHKTKEERMEVAQRLELWREEKKRKEDEEEECRLIEEIQKKRREKEERRQQLEVKLALEEHLRLKREEEEEQERERREEEQRELEERQRKTTRIIKSFSERDLHKVEAKLHEKQLKEKEEEERQKRIAAKLKKKVDDRINRDPSRLIRPTQGWQERMKHTGPSENQLVLQMFHRAVPTWRQGL